VISHAQQRGPATTLRASAQRTQRAEAAILDSDAAEPRRNARARPARRCTSWRNRRHVSRSAPRRHVSAWRPPGRGTVKAGVLRPCPAGSLDLAPAVAVDAPSGRRRPLGEATLARHDDRPPSAAATAGATGPRRRRRPRARGPIELLRVSQERERANQRARLRRGTALRRLRPVCETWTSTSAASPRPPHGRRHDSGAAGRGTRCHSHRPPGLPPARSTSVDAR
jgi:hypothetical protein